MSTPRALFGVELPDSWELATMGEVAKVVGGSTPKSKEPSYWDGPIPWLAVSDLTGYRDKYISAGARSITQAGYDSCATQLLPAGSVIFSSRAPIGYAAIAARDLCTSQGFKSFVPTDAVSSEYLYWYLQAARPLIEQLASGTTFKEISGRAAKTIPVPIPPRAEQDRIVEALWQYLERVDEGMDDIRDALARLPQLRAACLAAAFGGDEAEVHELDDLAAIRSGITKSPPKGTDLIAVPYIRTANVQAGFLDLKEIKELHVTNEQRARHLLQHGDVLVLEGGDADKVGRGWIWADEIPGAIHQNHVFAVRPDPDRLDGRYLAYYVNVPQARAYFLSKAKQTTNLASINKTQLRALPMPTPPIERQREIAQRLDREFAAITALRDMVAERMGEAQTLHRALLAEAFQGRLVAQDPADEPASELLERIRDRAGAADLQTVGVPL